VEQGHRIEITSELAESIVRGRYIKSPLKEG
jgi:hypothetical protein